jgi:DNA replication protein DnaC
VANWDWYAVDSLEFKQRISKKFQAFARTYDGKTSAVLLGSTGKGKTSSVIGAIRRMRLAAEEQVIARPRVEPERHQTLHTLARLEWYSGSQVALARKQSPLGTGEAKVVKNAIQASLLVVDEVGFEPFDGALFDVVDGRYMRQRPTIVTTGLTVDAFKTKYGDALWRRLTERGAVLEDFS